MTPPRIFCIPALDAPIVPVLRRGPTAWYHVGRWDVERGTYEPGSWLRGTLYPQRCDLSPDGRWLAYLALKPGATWDVGGTFIAISRLPWLTALAAWQTCGTWTLGLRFERDPQLWAVDDPSIGDLRQVRRRFGLRPNADVSFAVERPRGWTESSDTPPRGSTDPWEIRRGPRITMEKGRPGGDGVVLRVRGTYAAFRQSMPGERRTVEYEISDGATRHRLEDVGWADWDSSGRLLVATTDGRIQIRDGDPATLHVEHEVDLSELAPTPAEPPSEARTW